MPTILDRPRPDPPGVRRCRVSRPTGAVLLLTGIGALFLLHIDEGLTGNTGRLYVFLMLLPPLLYSGAACWGCRPEALRKASQAPCRRGHALGRGGAGPWIGFVLSHE